MRTTLKFIGPATVLMLATSLAMAKLPALSDEAKAKAAEAAAKTAWAGKVDGYQLCLAQDRVTGYYKKVPAPKAAPAGTKGAAVPAAATAGACTDPGPFVYTPNVALAPILPASGAPASVAQVKKP
jgi:hypothetical protein